MQSSHVKVTASKWAQYTTAGQQGCSQDWVIPADEIVTPDEQKKTYQPLCELLIQRWQAHCQHAKPGVPFCLGITGSVASGKSTIARCLQRLLQSQHHGPTVTILCTDHFLLNNNELTKLGIMERKGFPESYNTAMLIESVLALKQAKLSISIPRYSHTTYDIEVQKQVVPNADIIIIEGLHILQHKAKSPTEAASLASMLDLCLYIEADEQSLLAWFKKRITQHIAAAKSDKNSYYRKFISMPAVDVNACIHDAWFSINRKNLYENLRPLRVNADIIMHKNKHHQAQELWVKP